MFQEVRAWQDRRLGFTLGQYLLLIHVGCGNDEQVAKYAKFLARTFLAKEVFHCHGEISASSTVHLDVRAPAVSTVRFQASSLPVDPPGARLTGRP